MATKKKVAAKNPDWPDALDMLRLFVDQRVSKDEVSLLRSCGIIADICEAAQLGSLETYSARRPQIWVALGITKILDCSQDADLTLLYSTEKKLEVVDQDPRLVTLLSVDFTRVEFVNCLRQYEHIFRSDRLRMLQEMKEIRLGGGALFALWNDDKKWSKRSILRWIQSRKGVNEFHFPGLVLRDQNEGLCVPVFSCNIGSGHWYLKLVPFGTHASDVGLGIVLPA